MNKTEYLEKLKSLRSLEAIKETTIEYLKSLNSDDRCLQFLDLTEYDELRILALIDKLEHEEESEDDTLVQYGQDLLQETEKRDSPKEIYDWMQANSGSEVKWWMSEFGCIFPEPLICEYKHFAKLLIQGEDDIEQAWDSTFDHSKAMFQSKQLSPHYDAGMALFKLFEVHENDEYFEKSFQYLNNALNDWDARAFNPLGIMCMIRAKTTSEEKRRVNLYEYAEELFSRASYLVDDKAIYNKALATKERLKLSYGYTPSFESAIEGFKKGVELGILEAWDHYFEIRCDFERYKNSNDFWKDPKMNMTREQATPFMSPAIEFAKLTNPKKPYAVHVLNNKLEPILLTSDCTHISPLYQCVPLALHLLYAKGFRGVITLFTTAEPDHFTLDAISSFAGHINVSHLYFGTSLYTLKKMELKPPLTPSLETLKLFPQLHMGICNSINRQECDQMFRDSKECPSQLQSRELTDFYKMLPL